MIVKVEHDSKGTDIHYKDSGGYECWKSYDANGNLIHIKKCNFVGYVYEEWYEWNEEGEITHYKDSTGGESWLQK
jgi:hypothetical protein